MAKASDEQRFLGQLFASANTPTHLALQLGEAHTRMLTELGRSVAELAEAVARLGRQQLELQAWTRDPRAMVDRLVESSETLNEALCSYVGRVQEAGDELAIGYVQVINGVLGTSVAKARA
ncbi:MAG TPA: hypothetical protein VF265_10620 [Nevskiaceae bacterium]